MYSTKLSRLKLKEDASARVVPARGSDSQRYSAERVSMASLKTDSAERNKIGSGSENRNYSAKPPAMPMGKEVTGNRINSFHGK